MPHCARFAAIVLVAVSGSGCALDPAQALDDVTEAVTGETGPCFLYPDVNGYRVAPILPGSVFCADGSLQPSCHADRLDFSLMGLGTGQITTIVGRIAIATSSVDHASIVLQGEWAQQLVRDHITGKTYTYDVFRALAGYMDPNSAAHGATFFHLYGSTRQMALDMSLAHQLGFAAKVDLPPIAVLTNAAGVVTDGLVTGTVVNWSVIPTEIRADAYFAPF